MQLIGHSPFMALIMLGATASASAADAAPPISCDIRTQFWCVATGSSNVTLSEEGGRRMWSVRDTDTGAVFKILEDKSCREFANPKIALNYIYKERKGFPNFRFDSYNLDETKGCSVDIGYEVRHNGKESYSEILSNGQVLFCNGWLDGACKQRFDFTPANR
jgi:hypothetical protein